MSRDTKDQLMDAPHIALPLGDDQPEEARGARLRRRAACCIRVAPWTSACSCVMFALGLAVWYLYTKKALAYTDSVAGQLFGARPLLVAQLGAVVAWTTLIGVIVGSCMLGITLFVTLIRTFQLTARLPATSCGAPGKLSYGSYAGFVALLNFGWWLITIAVSLLIAANLVWLTLAFATSSAVSMGVRYVPEASQSNAALYTTARGALDSLATYATKVQKAVPAAVAGLPEVEALNSNVRAFVAASKEVPVTVCPTSCLNVGSFYDTLRLPTSCVCSDANMLDVSDTAVNTWKALVHVLAALALMGLACLWLLMHLSAEFAHARRDARELPGRSPTALTRDAVAAIQAAPYSSSSSKKLVAKTSTPTRDQDTARFVALAGAEFTAIDAMPESLAAPAIAAEPAMTFSAAYEAYAQEPAGGAAALADAPAPAPSPKRRAASPSPRNGDAEQPSPSSGRGATLNSTAQRYAAYRLRAAQAAAAKGSPSEGGRKQWQR